MSGSIGLIEGTLLYRSWPHLPLEDGGGGFKHLRKVPSTLKVLYRYPHDGKRLSKTLYASESSED